MILSGILLTPTGVPYSNSLVRITANNTSPDVLMFVTKDFKTDTDGEYEIDVPNGWYKVSVFVNDYHAFTSIGNIEITDDTTETTINALLMIGQTAHSDPLVAQVAANAASALASKNAAAVSATSSANSATTSQTAATASQTSATNSANSASSANTSAGVATTKAAEAVVSAQDAQDSAELTASLLSTKVSVVDLANSVDTTKGATGVGWTRQALSSATDFKTVSSILGTEWICVTEFAHLITVKPTPNDIKTWDWTPAIAGAQAKALELASVTYGGYGVSFPAGVYPVTRIVHYSGVPLRGMGSRNTFITALPFTPSGPNPYGMLELNIGPVQGAHIEGLTFAGSSTPVYGAATVNTNQWGFYCWAQYDAGNVQGGFWHSNVVDVAFWNFNNGIWSRGGYTHANSRRPNQWITFEGVQVVVQDGGQPWLFTGQHGQISVRGGHGEGISAATPKRALYSAKITVDPDPSTTASNGINGESTSDVSGVGNANRAGHNINFCQGYSFQRSRKGIWVNGPARNISVDSCWFETLAEAATVEGDSGLCLTNNHFANAAIGTTAGGAAGSGYIVSLGANSQMDWGLGNVVEGSFDHFVSDISSGANECRGFNFLGSMRADATGSVILPTLPQRSPTLDASGFIDVSSHRFATVAANTDKTIRLSKIVSNLLPNQIVTLRAASGSVTIKNSAGGNLVTGTGKDMTIPSGGIATFLRIHPYVTGSEFLLLSVSDHYASAVPTDGFFYTQGHVIKNIATAAGVPAGWVCTTSGLAGTTAVFKAMANLV